MSFLRTFLFLVLYLLMILGVGAIVCISVGLIIAGYWLLAVPGVFFAAFWVTLCITGMEHLS